MSVDGREQREFLIFQFAVIVRLHLFDLSLGENISPFFKIVRGIGGMNRVCQLPNDNTVVRPLFDKALVATVTRCGPSVCESTTTID